MLSVFESTFIVSCCGITDITESRLPGQYDFWHDGAAFHFLLTKMAIIKYVGIAEAAIGNKDFLMSGNFPDNGPDKCSGLQIQQYNESSMTERFEVIFGLIKCYHEDHATPFNTAQHFIFYDFQKK